MRAALPGGVVVHGTVYAVSTYANDETGQATSSPIEAYEFIGSATTWRVTSAIEAVTIDGNSYTPLAGLRRGGMHHDGAGHAEADHAEPDDPDPHVSSGSASRIVSDSYSSPARGPRNRLPTRPTGRQ